MSSGGFWRIAVPELGDAHRAGPSPQVPRSSHPRSGAPRKRLTAMDQSASQPSQRERYSPRGNAAGPAVAPPQWPCPHNSAQSFIPSMGPEPLEAMNLLCSYTAETAVRDAKLGYRLVVTAVPPANPRPDRAGIGRTGRLVVRTRVLPGYRRPACLDDGGSAPQLQRRQTSARGRRRPSTHGRSQSPRADLRNCSARILLCRWVQALKQLLEPTSLTSGPALQPGHSEQFRLAPVWALALRSLQQGW